MRMPPTGTSVAGRCRRKYRAATIPSANDARGDEVGVRVDALNPFIFRRGDETVRAPSMDGVPERDSR